MVQNKEIENLFDTHDEETLMSTLCTIKHYTAYHQHGSNILMTACLYRMSRLVKELVKVKVVDINSRNDYGDTALIIAAGLDTDLVTYLVSHGADPNARNRDGSTALMQAVMYKQLETVKVLQPICDVNITDQYGNTALMIAAKYGYEDIMRLLLPCTNKNIVNDDFDSVYILASTKGIDVEKLIDKEKK